MKFTHYVAFAILPFLVTILAGPSFSEAGKVKKIAKKVKKKAKKVKKKAKKVKFSSATGEFVGVLETVNNFSKDQIKSSGKYTEKKFKQAKKAVAKLVQGQIVKAVKKAFTKNIPRYAKVFVALIKARPVVLASITKVTAQLARGNNKAAVAELRKLRNHKALKSAIAHAHKSMGTSLFISLKGYVGGSPIPVLSGGVSGGLMAVIHLGTSKPSVVLYVSGSARVSLGTTTPGAGGGGTISIGFMKGKPTGSKGHKLSGSAGAIGLPLPGLSGLSAAGRISIGMGWAFPTKLTLSAPGAISITFAAGSASKAGELKNAGVRFDAGYGYNHPIARFK